MLKRVSKILLVVLSIGTSLLIFPPHFSSASATDTNFQVNVKEILSVSITPPSTWASGDAGEFLRNSITLGVTTNSINGFTAGLATETTDTSLTNTANSNLTIPNLNSATNRNYFQANHWGYSINDDSNTGLYEPLKSSIQAPDTVLCDGSSCTGPTGNSKTIFFGTKANFDKASGTYTSTVVISVVSGTNGADLDGPATDADEPNPNPNTPYYNSNTQQTTYTYTTGNTTTTQVTEGDNTSNEVYDGYTPPQGVTNVESSNIYNGSLLTTILATTASIAAGSGIFFFILAKRKKDDDEKEDQTE